MKKFVEAVKEALYISSAILLGSLVLMEAVGPIVIMIAAIVLEDWAVILHLIPLLILTFLTILVLNLINK